MNGQITCDLQSLYPKAGCDIPALGYVECFLTLEKIEICPKTFVLGQMMVWVRGFEPPAS